MQSRTRGLALIFGAILIACSTQGARADAPKITTANNTLAQFVHNVVESNPRVQAAYAALETSGALRDAASRPLYNPELSFDAENAETKTRALGISQTLDWGGKRRSRTVVAESNRLVAEAEYLETKWSITVELLNGLARHQLGVDGDLLAETRTQLMDDFAALAERRFTAGDLNQVELDLARLSATDARIQKATAGTRLAETRQAVRNLAGRSDATQWPTMPDSTPPLPTKVDPQSLVLALPEVVAARRQVESAKALVELRRRERRPDPTLSFRAGEEDDQTLIGLNMSIPLHVRNSFNYEVTAALAEHSRAEQLADDVLQRAYARLVSASERYELSSGAWGQWASMGQTSLARQTEQLQRLWRAGEISTTDYLVQLTATLDVQANALDLREGLWRAWFEWLWASGQVDAWLGQGDRS